MIYRCVCLQSKLYHNAFCSVQRVILSGANVPVARCGVERGKTCNELRVLTSKSAVRFWDILRKFRWLCEGVCNLFCMCYGCYTESKSYGYAIVDPFGRFAPSVLLRSFRYAKLRLRALPCAQDDTLNGAKRVMVQLRLETNTPTNQNLNASGEC